MSALSHTPGPWKAIEWACHAATTVVAEAKDAVRAAIAKAEGRS